MEMTFAFFVSEVLILSVPNPAEFCLVESHETHENFALFVQGIPYNTIYSYER
jgi:hypothetical protein